jgi:hypothetical protein
MASHTPAGNSRRRLFFVLFSLALVTLVVTAFRRTLFATIALHTFVEPWFVYVHGALLLSWFGLLIIQSAFAASGYVSIHRRVGLYGMLVVPLIGLSTIQVVVFAARRDASDGSANEPITNLFGELLDVALFMGLAATAFILRRHPQTHKRLVLIATLVVIGAAVGRIPMLGEYPNTVTFALLATVAARDIIKRRSLHAATLCGGLALITASLIETPIGQTTAWHQLARWILSRA